MPASREIFWNIQLGEFILYPLAAIAVGILIYSIYRRYRVWTVGKKDNHLGSLGKRIRAFIVTAIVDGFGHKRILNHLYPGIMHVLIFWGCLVLLIGAFLDALSHYWLHFLQGTFYLVSSLVIDAFGIIVLVGVIIAAYRRYIQRPKRLDNRTEDAVALALIFVVVITGFLVEGFRLAAPEPGSEPSWAIWSPGGFIVANTLADLTESTKLMWHCGLWWFHTLLALGAIIYVSISFSKLSHILVSPLNAFFRPFKPRGMLESIDIETAETLGVAKIEEFSWKHLLDLDACTRCGRCQDNCPAYLSGKPLSPKKVIQDLKGQLVSRGVLLINNKNNKSAEVANPGLCLAGEVVSEDEIWACTTCGACIEHCPVYIDPIAKIIEMRRYLTLMQGKMPEAVHVCLDSMQKRGQPFAGSQYLRLRDDWTKGLEIKKLSQDSNVDILLWVGCTAALDDCNIEVILSVVNILKRAEVNFGILGGEETCCGDPARRLGYELLFPTLVQRNIDTFNRYGVKKIVTACPHCFNTIKHEYPQLGGNFEVVHHTQFIADLLRKGKLKPNTGVDMAVTYHDPCYLGRHNEIYKSPRQILSFIPKLKRAEMKRCRGRSLCCGGGGGHLWMEEEPGKRVNELRIEDVVKTKAEVAVTACPYCLIMLRNAREEKGLKEQIQIMDVAQLLNMAME